MNSLPVSEDKGCHEPPPRLQQHGTMFSGCAAEASDNSPQYSKKELIKGAVSSSANTRMKSVSREICTQADADAAEAPEKLAEPQT